MRWKSCHGSGLASARDLEYITSLANPAWSVRPGPPANVYPSREDPVYFNVKHGRDCEYLDQSSVVWLGSYTVAMVGAPKRTTHDKGTVAHWFGRNCSDRRGGSSSDGKLRNHCIVRITLMSYNNTRSITHCKVSFRSGIRRASISLYNLDSYQV